MQARARNQKPMKHKTAEEELRVKIETAKRDIRAKEESVAARRARKDAKREEWIIKQKADYEKREAKLQEQARMQPEAQGAEMDGARMMSTGAAEKTVVKEEDYDIDFDIDIYGDEQRRHSFELRAWLVACPLFLKCSLYTFRAHSSPPQVAVPGQTESCAIASCPQTPCKTSPSW
jgi:hypothetical protein